MKLNKNNLVAIIGSAVVLFLIALGWGIYLNSSNSKLDRNVGSLEQQRDSLEITVSDLEKRYQEVSEDYKALEGTIEEARQQISEKEELISNLRSLNKNAAKRSSAEIDSLSKKIQVLLDSQKELLTSVEDLEEEKNSLLVKMQEAKTEMDNLNDALEKEMENLAYARFVGTGFQTDIEKRNDKVTVKARQAREIVISFDLNDVPKRFQGLQELFLVITDEASTPISVIESTKATVEVKGEPVELQAQQVIEMEIVKDQKVTFTYGLDDKLPAGTYHAKVYAAKAMLGSVSFQLR